MLKALRIALIIGAPVACAFAQTVSVADFSAANGLKLNGTAASASTKDGHVLRLTNAQGWSAGSAFTNHVVPFQNPADSFSTFFQFRITEPGGVDPADGIFFVLRATGTADLGGSGQGQGYDGIPQSLGVKFDTFQNAGEINDNHVALQINGTDVDGSATTPYNVGNCTKPAGVQGCMANGDLWSVWVDYDGANIHVALADNSTVRPTDLLVAPVSLPQTLNFATGAYAGFTAGTGAGWETHDIINWRFDSVYNPTPVGVTQILPSASGE